MKWIKKVATTPLDTIAKVIDSLSGNSATNAPSINAVKEAITSLMETINAKQDIITLTANKAVITDANGKLKASSTAAAKLGYLANVNGDIQEQLDEVTSAVSTKAVVTGLSKTKSVTAANAGDIYSVTFAFDSSDGYTQSGDAGIISVLSNTNSIRIDSVTKGGLVSATHAEYYVLYHGTSNGATGNITFNTIMIDGYNPYTPQA